ncbi:MAG TPA: tRNA lysidine(34) synthetase TilS, partial [Alphaproteobacteria bacterium]|nr:tRNA lysidine(34) synthetase TilS [Alphaproteobacteria bacterium]
TLRELQITREVPATLAEYCYKLTVPGEVAVPELGATIRAQVVRAEAGNKGYNPALLLDRKLLAAELTVRNWRAGDRFFPAHTHSPKRVKELLQAGRLGQDLSAAERKAWPVIESGGEIVWMRGFPVPAAFETRSEQAVLIEEIRTDSQW